MMQAHCLPVMTSPHAHARVTYFYNIYLSSVKSDVERDTELTEQSASTVRRSPYCFHRLSLNFFQLSLLLSSSSPIVCIRNNRENEKKSRDYRKKSRTFCLDAWETNSPEFVVCTHSG